MPQRFEQELEGCGISKGSGLSYEEKFLLIESLVEKVEKLSAEDDTEGFDMEQKVFTGRTPALLIERQSSSGDQTMEMKMIQQGLVPGVQHCDQTDLSAQRSAAKINERFTDSFKEIT